MRQSWSVTCLAPLVPHASTPIHFVEHPNQQPRQLTHSLSHSISLSTLTHIQARRGEGKERKGEGDWSLQLLGWRWRSPRRRAPQEVRVEGGGALSPLVFGARRRRQEARTKSPRLDPASPPPLRSMYLSFCRFGMVWYFDLSPILSFHFHEH
jgi:hypothetical protein